MTRLSLKPFKNKVVIVTARIHRVFYKNILDKEHVTKQNVRILLKEVKVAGIDIDHVWLYEKNKQYAIATDLINQRVKFKAFVEPYYKVNKENNLFVQDYGLRRKTKLLSEACYMQQFQPKMSKDNDLTNIEFKVEDFL